MSDSTAAGLSTLYRQIWHYAAGMRGRMLLAFTLLTASQLVKLAVPWMAAQAIDTIQSGGGADGRTAVAWIGGIVGLCVLSWALHGPGRILERNVGIRVRQGLADALFARLMRLPLAWHDRHHSGEVGHRVGQATHALSDFAQTQFIYLQNLVNIAGPLVALWLLSAATGAVAVAGYALIGLVIVRFDAALMRLAAQENQADRRYAAGLLDFIGNVSSLTSLRLQGAARRLLGARLQAVFAPLGRSIVLTEAKWCVVDLATVALTWGLVLAYAWRAQGAGGALMLGTLFMVYQYAQQAGGVVGSMAANYQAFARTRTDFASAAPVWQATERAAPAATIAADWQTIRLAGLGYTHARGDAEAAGIEAVGLTLTRGERVALVGPSGSGKSTLLRVLAGLYEAQRGHVEVDGVAPLGLRHVAAIATLIPQEAEVFEATVGENITFGEPVDARALDDALHASAFDRVAQALPQGLATPISERGFNLSGGQRQRLALARGILAARASSMVLLDEPTSALDPLTEAQIHRRIDVAFAAATLVAAVHRMSLLAHFDRVVLMAGGRVLDSGSIAELLERQPLFRELYRGAQTTAAPDAGDAGAPVRPERAVAV